MENPKGDVVMLDGFISTALGSLQVAASSPLAFAAYALALIVYLICFFRVARFKHLMEKIEKIPDSERWDVIREEMKGIPLPKNISAEEWLVARKQKIIAGAVTATIVLILLLAAIIYWEYRGYVDVSIELNADSASHEEEIYFRSTETDGVLYISPESRYINLINSGRRVKHEDYDGKDSEDLSLVFKVVNNTPDKLILSKVDVDIEKIELVEKIIPVVSEDDGSSIEIINVGWADFVNPVRASVNFGPNDASCGSLSESNEFINFNSSENKIVMETSLFPVPPTIYEGMYICSDARKFCIGEISEGKCDSLSTRGMDVSCDYSVPPSNGFQECAMPQEGIDNFIAFARRQTPPESVFHTEFDLSEVRMYRSCYPETRVCAAGNLKYKDSDGTENIFRFEAHPNIKPKENFIGGFNSGSFLPISATYEVFLTSDIEKYQSYNISVSHQLEKGEADSFEIIFESDKSALFVAKISLIGPRGVVLFSKPVYLEFLVWR